MISDFLDAKSSMSRTGKKAYTSTLSRFKDFCDNRGIEPVNADTKHVSEYIQQFEDNAYKTRISYLTILRSYYSWLERRGHIKFNPCVDVTLQGNARKKEQQLMTDEDFGLILSRCENDRQKVMLYFLYYTGVRAKEFINIRVDDVDIENRTVWVGVSKSSSGNRSIPIAMSLYPILSAYMTARKQFNTDEPWLFLTETTKTKMAYRTLLYYIKRIQDNLGTDFTPHDFRRSAGTRLYNKTQDIVMVQQFLGHSSIETTRKYILGDNTRLQAISRMDF